MKKFTLFLVIAAIFGTLSFSCSSDDDLSTSNSIVGEWRVLNSTTTGTLRGVPFDPEITDYTALAERSTVSFTANGRYNTRIYELEDGELSLEEDSGTYRINGNNLIITPERDSEQTVIFSIQNNRLTLTSREENETFSITTIIVAERI